MNREREPRLPSNSIKGGRLLCLSALHVPQTARNKSSGRWLTWTPSPLSVQVMGIRTFPGFNVTNPAAASAIDHSDRPGAGPAVVAHDAAATAHGVLRRIVMELPSAAIAYPTPRIAPGQRTVSPVGTGPARRTCPCIARAFRSRPRLRRSRACGLAFGSRCEAYTPPG